MNYKICSKLVLFVLAVQLPRYAKSEGSSITCDAPSVPRHQTAHVTCHFGQDLSLLDNFIVNVELYPYGQDDLVEVLQCQLLPGSQQQCPTLAAGYVFDGDTSISTRLTVDILNASSSNVGRYACKLQSTHLKEAGVGHCPFHLTGEIPPGLPVTPKNSDQSEDSGSGFPILPVAIGGAAVVLVIILTVIVTIVVCRRSRQRSTPDGDAEQHETLATKPTSGENEDALRNDAGDNYPLMDKAAKNPPTDAEPPPKPPRLSISSPSSGEEGENMKLTAAENEDTGTRK